MFNAFFLLNLIGIIGVLYCYFRGIEHSGIRDAFIKTFISFSLFVWATTEAFGMSNLLISKAFQSCYLFVLLIGILFLKTRRVSLMEIVRVDLKVLQDEIPLYFKGTFKYLFFFFIGTTLLLSLYVAPNNTDALGYHIARVMFWAQNNNLYHYPTEFSPQLYYNVLSEYFFLHLYLGSGSDYYFNCVHWSAMLMVLLTTSKLLHIWGSNKAIQGLGIIFTLAIPQVILQSTSSQNDLLSASYFLVSVYFGYQIVVNKFSYTDYIWGLLAFLLGGFTKYSVFIIGFPLILFFAVYQFVKFPSRAMKLGFISILFFLAIFGPFFYRNYLLMEQFIAPAKASPLFIGSYTSEVMNWKSFVSNLMKIIGNHLSLPIQSWNICYDQWVSAIHFFIEFPLNSSLNSFDKYVTSFTIGEDFSGNFIHFLSLTFLVFYLMVKRSTWVAPQVKLFSLLVIGFCFYVLIFKWQRFHARTQMAFFVASAPLVIFIISEKWKVTEYKIKFFAWIFLIQGLPFLLFNSIKPIIPLSYFVKRSMRYMPSSIAAKHNDTVLVKKLIDQNYYLIGSDSQLNRSSNITWQKAQTGFNLLEKIGLFEQDKRWIGSVQDRFSHYVLYNYMRYNELNEIFRLLGAKRKHIGFHSYSSFVSPFFIIGKSLIGDEFQLKYIQYSALFNGKQNIDSNYQYDAILTDDDNFVEKLPANIGQIVRLNTWTVVLLDEPSRRVYHHY